MKSSKTLPIDDNGVVLKKAIDNEENHTDGPKDDAEKEKEEAVPTISYFKLFRYSDLLDKCMMFIGIMAAIVSGVCTPLNTLLFGELTGDMVQHAIDMITKEGEELEKAQEEFIDNITEFAVYNSLLGAVILVCTYVATVTLNYSALRQSLRIRSKFLEASLNQDVAWYDLNRMGEFSSRMSEDIFKVEEGIGEKMTMCVTLMVTFVGALVLAFVKGWELALICLISLPVTMISLGIISKVSSGLAKKEGDAYGKAGSIAEETLSAIRTVVAFGGQKKEITRFRENLVFACDINIKRSFLSGLAFGILWFVIYGSYALAFWYGVKLIIDEIDVMPPTDRTYNPTIMVTVFFSVFMGSMNFGMASPYFEAFAVACGSASKVFSVIDNKPVINKSKRNGEKPSEARGNIEMKDVYFNYPSRAEVPILTGLNLKIQEGETVALVGTSGCGKSTCIQLVQRFYDPDAGSVLLDGVDIKDLDLEWLRNKIGVVGQEPVLFGTTIGENIRFGFFEATQADIEEAAKKSNAHNFIMKLPNQYDTLVGERGTQLSGGQKQRIAIARALVRQPKILILDEATSALDTKSEAQVQAAIDNASQACTTIIIAHRLSTIKGADKIIVLSKGQAVEEGKHSDLMAAKGAYYNLVQAQVSAQPGEEKEEKSEEKGQQKIRTLSSSSDPSLHLKKSEEEVDDEEKVKEPSLWKIIRANSKEWKIIVLGCIASIAAGGAMPIFAVVFGDIVGVLSKSDPDVVRSESNTYCLYFLIIGIVMGVSTFLQIYSFGIAGEKLTKRLRGEMFEAMLRQEMGWFDNRDNGVGSLCSRLSVEASSVQGATGMRVGTALQSLGTLFLSVSLAMYYEWRLGLVALAFSPFILVFSYLQTLVLFKENRSQLEGMEKATKFAVEGVSNIRTVISLSCEDKFHELYLKELVPSHKKALRNTHMRALVYGVARSLMFFAYATCMYYGGFLVRDDNVPYEDVFKVSQSLIMGTASIANALAFAPNFSKGLTAAANIFHLLEREPKIQDRPKTHDPQQVEGSIDYLNVLFAYPTRKEVSVLKNFNLSILKGKTVALVGPSGGGKSTVVQLLERFYEPTKGTVSIDKQDIQDMSLSGLRSRLGIVSQEPTLFDRTIADNIAYGDNSRDVQRQEVMAAAMKANIHNFIVSLPLGYETVLGEKGTQLSGGQKQRIAIARALLRNPKVLLLDEATSALDVESEKVVQEALDKAKEGRTCITIAHRLTTIQDADLICVINNGIVDEMGSHAELLQQKGIYHQLHTLQSTMK